MTRGALRQVLTLLGGLGLSQLIALAASPILSRLYGPADYGAFALVLSVTALLATAATGRFEAAVIVPADDADAWQLVCLALILALAMAGLCVAAVALGGDVLAARLGLRSAAAWAWLLPVLVALTAALATLTAWANRGQRYTVLAGNRVAQGLASALTTLALGAAGWGVPGLLLGSVVGLALAVLLLARHTAGMQAPDRSAMRRLTRAYRNFPRISLPHALLDAVQASLVLMLLGAAFGEPAIGAYAFALRVARTPLAMVGSSVGQVFQQRAARLAEPGGDPAQLGALARATTVRLAAFGLPCVALLMVAPALFEWVFGPAWRESGECARVLAPWILMSLLTSPLSQLPLILQHQARALAFGIAYQLAMVLPLVIAAWLHAGLLQALAAQSLAASAVLLAYGVWLHRLAGGLR